MAQEDGARVTARVLRGSAFILASRIINAASLFAVSIVLARYLGPEEYGLIAIATGVAGMLEIIGALGMNTGAARYIPFYQARGEGDNIRRVVSINLTTKVAVAVMLAALLYISAGLLAGFFDKDVERLMQIAAIVLALNTLGGAFQGILRGFQRLGVMALANVVRDVVWMVSAIGLTIAAGMGVEGALWGIVAGGIVWSVISLAAMVHALGTDVHGRDRLEGRYDRRVVMALVTFGVPVLLSNLLFMVFDWTGTYVLAYFQPVEAVSVYNVAFGIVTIPLVLIKAIGIAMLPAMSHAFGEGRLGLMGRLWGGALKLVNVLIFPLAAAMMVLAAPAVLLVYGHDYVDGALPMLVLSVYLLVRPTGIMATHVLAAMARQDLIFRVNLLSVAVNIAMGIALVPGWSILGAAVAASTAFVLNSLLLHHYARVHAGVEMDHRSVRCLSLGAALVMLVAVAVFVLTGPMGLGWLPLLVRLVGATLAGFATYLVFVRRVGMFSRDELKDVERVAEHSRLAALVLPFLR